MKTFFGILNKVVFFPFQILLIQVEITLHSSHQDFSFSHAQPKCVTNSKNIQFHYTFWIRTLQYKELFELTIVAQ